MTVEITPEEVLLAAQLDKAQDKANVLRRRLWQAEEARRHATPDCGRGQHDIEVIVTHIFTVYRCRRCPDEEWL